MKIRCGTNTLAVPIYDACLDITICHWCATTQSFHFMNHYLKFDKLFATCLCGNMSGDVRMDFILGSSPALNS